MVATVSTAPTGPTSGTASTPSPAGRVVWAEGRLCEPVDVILSIYKVPDSWNGDGFPADGTAVPQTLIASAKGTVGKDGRLELEVPVPDCGNVQIDLYYPPEITAVTAAGHGDQLIEGYIWSIGGPNGHPKECEPTPTPTPTDTETPTPTPTDTETPTPTPTETETPTPSEEIPDADRVLADPAGTGADRGSGWAGSGAAAAGAAHAAGARRDRVQQHRPAAGARDPAAGRGDRAQPGRTATHRLTTRARGGPARRGAGPPRCPGIRARHGRRPEKMGMVTSHEAPSPDVRRTLRADCENCFGLCCVAPAFSASADFAIDKSAGQACPHLRSDFRCGIHRNLRQQGFPGCAGYDCFGAGQKVAQVTFGGRDWRRTPLVAARMFDTFTIMRQLHELLWYLTEALTLQPARPLHGQLGLALEQTERHTYGSPEALLRLDMTAYRRDVNTLLLRASELVRAGVRRDAVDRQGADLVGKDLSGADFRAASLRGAYLIGADLSGADLGMADLLGADCRGADLSGAELADSIFLTQSQLDAARGDRRTTLPPSLTRPRHWAQP